MMKAFIFKRVNQRLQDVRLPCHFTEIFRPPFAGQNLICHAPCWTRMKKMAVLYCNNRANITLI
jgi:hypothetical protein